jgi:hypothetical protein
MTAALMFEGTLLGLLSALYGKTLNLSIIAGNSDPLRTMVAFGGSEKLIVSPPGLSFAARIASLSVQLLALQLPSFVSAVELTV